MLWMASTAGLIGLLCGCLFRVPALIFLSFLSFGGAVVLTFLGGTLGHALFVGLVLTASLQCGYLLGAILCHMRQHLRIGLGHNFRRAPQQEPLPHR